MCPKKSNINLSVKAANVSQRLAYNLIIEYNGGSEWQMRLYNGMTAFTQRSRLNFRENLHV